MECLRMTEWSPYAVGIGIGLLSCVTFFVSDKPIGCSTVFSRTSGMLETLFRPGTLAGAVGQGSLDALFGGLIGILLGAGLFAEFHPRLDKAILSKGHFGELTWPQLLNVNPWLIIIPVAIGMIALLFWIEKTGL